MEKLKKVLCIVLSLAMVFTMQTTSLYASDSSGSAARAVVEDAGTASQADSNTTSAGTSQDASSKSTASAAAAVTESTEDTSTDQTAGSASQDTASASVEDNNAAGTSSSDAALVSSSDTEASAASEGTDAASLVGDTSTVNLKDITAEGGLTVTLKDTTTGKTIPTDSTQIGRKDSLSVTVDFTLDNTKKSTAIGKSIVYDLSGNTGLKISNGITNDDLYSGNTKVGTYSITTDGKIILNVDSEFLSGKSDVKGFVAVNFTLESSATTDKDSITFEFPGTANITATFTDTVITGTKTYAVNSDGTITFTVELDVDSKSTNVKLTDDLGTDFSFKKDTFALDGTPITEAISDTNPQEATLDLGTLDGGKHYLTYKATINNYTDTNNDANHNKVTWTWDANHTGTYDTSVNLDDFAVSIKKDGAVETSSNGSVIDWTITLDKNKFPNGFVDAVLVDDLSETLSQNLSLDTSSWKVKDADGNDYTSGNGAPVWSETARTLTYKFDEKATSSSYTITFKTNVDTSKITTEGYNWFRNKASITPSNGKTESTYKDVDITYYPLSKDDGSRSNLNVTWTLHVNKGGTYKENLAGKKIVDTLPAKLSYDANTLAWTVKDSDGISYTEGGTPVWDPTARTLTYTFGPNAGAKEYTITYVTKIDTAELKPGKITTITNKVKLTDKDGGIIGPEKTGKVDYDYEPDDISITKTNDTFKNKIADKTDATGDLLYTQWTTSVTFSKATYDLLNKSNTFKIDDVLAENTDMPTGIVQNDTLHPIVVKVNGAEKTSTQYTVTPSLPVTVGSESLNRKFVITFGETPAPDTNGKITVTVSYWSVSNIAGISQTDAKKYITENNVAGVWYTYDGKDGAEQKRHTDNIPLYYQHLVENKAFSKKFKSDFTLNAAGDAYTTTCEVVANAENDYTDGGILDLTGSQIVITDTMGAGLDYVAGSAKVQLLNGTNDLWLSGNKVFEPTVTGDVATGKTLTWDFSKCTDSTIIAALAGKVGITIAYTASTAKSYVESESSKNGGSTSITYTNGASMTKDGETFGSGSDTKTLTVTKLTKDGSQVSGSAYITYSIDVNKEKLDLDPNSDSVTLSDTIPSELSLLVNSPEIVGDDGNKVPIDSTHYYTYDSSTNKIEFILPDEHHYKLTYQVQFKNQDGASHEVTNTVVLKGQTNISSDKKASYVANTASAGITGIAGQIVLFKTDKDNVTLKLNGATYALYRVDSVSNPAGTLIDTQTTGEDGTLTFSKDTVAGTDAKLQSDVLYYYVETETPTNGTTTYELDGTKYYFYFAGTSPNAVPALASELKVTPSSLSNIGLTLTVTDTAVKTGSLTVTKAVTGLTTAAAAGAYSFTFYVKNGDKYAEFDANKVFTGLSDTLTDAAKVTITNGDTEAVTLTGLPIGNYTVKEDTDAAKTAVTNYDLTGTTYTYNSDPDATYVGITGGDAENAAISNSYAQSVGSLKIVKTTDTKEGDSPAATPDDTTFTVTGVNGQVASVTYSQFENGEYTVTNLAPGNYTVTENVNDAVVAGYTLTVDGNSAEKAVASNATTEFDITNTYSRDRGALKITKTTTPEGMTPADATFTITSAPTDYTGTSVFHYSDFTDGVLTLTDIPAGSYTIEESGADVTNYTLTVNGNATAAVTKDSTADSPAEVTINNNYSQDFGNLEIVKTTNSSDNSNQATPGTTKFTITSDGGYSKTVTYSEFTNGKYKLEKIPTGNYTVVETNDEDAQIAGYTLAVTGDNNKAKAVAKDATANFDITNTYSKDFGRLKLTKATSPAGLTPANTVFTLTYPDGTTTKDVKYSEFAADGTYTFDNLPTGRYTVTESVDSAKVDGYVLVVSGGNGEAQLVEKDETADVKITNTYTQTSVDFSKVDVGGTEIGGAVISILDTNGNVVKDSNGKAITWESRENESHTVTGLKADTTYRMHEVTAPSGYSVVTDVEFTIAKDGTVSTTNSANYVNNKVTMTDTATSVTFSKQDLGGNEIKGALIQILDKDGKLAKDGSDSEVFWTSEDGKSHVVTGLAAGDYTMHEDTAPAGYKTTKDIKFTINTDGTVSAGSGNDTATSEVSGTKVTMKDDVTSVTFSKQDLGGKEIGGAQIEIRDEKGNVVKDKDNNEVKWTSEAGKSHTVTGITAGTYAMHEEVAPNGYKVTTDIVFTIAKDGTVTTKNSADYINDKVTMKDDVTSVTFSKQDLGSGKEIGGAQIEIRDENGVVVKDKDNNEVKWTSEAGKSHTVTGITAGTYTMHEVVAPNGYTVTTDIKFTIDKNGKVSGDSNNDSKTSEVSETKVIMKDDVTSVSFSKTDLGGTEIGGAKIQILASNGKVASDKDNNKLEWTSEADKTKVITGLAAGTYTMHEDTAPDGYNKATDITFTIGTDGKVTSDALKNDVVTMTDTLTAFDVTVSKTDLTTSKELPGAVLKVTTDAEGKNIVNDAKTSEALTWASTTDSKVVHLTMGTYYLTETTAPYGYYKAETIKFTVNKDGAVSGDTTNNTTTSEVSGTKVTMKDKVSTAAVSLKVFKDLENRDWTDKDSFSFTLSSDAINTTNGFATVPMPEKDTTVTITNSGSHTASFGDISFHEAGTFYYDISENNAAANLERGITNGGSVYVKVVVTKDESTDTMTAKVSYETASAPTTPDTATWTDYDSSNGITVTNAYATSNKISVPISVNKSFTGHDWTTKYNFTINLTGDNDAAKALLKDSGNTLQLTATSQKKKVTYTLPDISAAGTYIFRIQEANADKTVSGISYASPLYVKAVVTDNGEGQLIAALQYKSGDGAWGDYPQDNTLNLKNFYAYNNVSTAFKVTKNVTPRDWTEDDSFSFKLTADSINASAPMPSSDTEVTVTEASKTGTFGGILYEKTGVYYYDINEENAEANARKGLSNAPTGYVMAVVTDDGEGQLVVQNYYGTVNPALATASDWTKDTTSAGITMTNKYKAAPTKAAFTVVKNLEGRDWTSSDAFKFTLSSLLGAPMTSDSKVSLTMSNKTGSFGEIKFTAAGTYYYVITEDNAGTTVNGITYPAATYVKAVVTDNNDGTLSETTYYGNVAPNVASDTDWTKDGTGSGVEITNTYAAASTTAGVSVVKDLENRDWTDADAFSFKLTADAATTDAPMPTTTSVSITNKTANHTAAFGNAVYTAAGTYYYDLTETNADGTAISGTTTADGLQNAAVKYVKVTVTDNGKGALTAAVSYGSKAPAEAKDSDWTKYDAAEGIKMVNTYIGTSTQFGLRKRITANGSALIWSSADSITMNLEGVSAVGANGESLGSVPMPDSSAIVFDGNTTWTAAGKFYTSGNTFDKIAYTQPGVYTYKVSEGKVVFNEGSTVMYNDMSVYTVKVTVKADETTGQLSTAITYAKTTDRQGNEMTNVTYKDYTSANALDFLNSYVKDFTTVDVTVTKNWQDSLNAYGTRPDTLNFTLIKTASDGSYTEIPETVTIDKTAAQQTFTFEKLEEADTDGNKYTYTVKETSQLTGYSAPVYSNDTLTVTNTLAETGAVAVKKTDLSGNVLSGAVFKLYMEKTAGTKDTTKDTVVATVTTGTTGISTVTGLKAGTYYFQETAAPDGYKISTELSEAITLTAADLATTAKTPAVVTVADTKIPTDSSTTTSSGTTTTTSTPTRTTTTSYGTTTVYTTTTSKASTTSTATTSTASNAKTGDNAPLELYTVLLLGAFAAIAVALKKKKAN